MSQFAKVTVSLLILMVTGLAQADLVRFLGRPEYSLEARVSVIESAQKEIYFQVYQTGDTTDQLTMQFLTLLYAASVDPTRPNLQVFIVFDWLAQKLNPSIFQAMMLNPDGSQNLRMHLRLFDQFMLFHPLMIDNRMHNKLLVADGKYAIVGGRNMTQDYFDLDCVSAGDNYIDTDVLIQRSKPAFAGDIYDRSLSETQVHSLSAPERFQRYAHILFEDNNLQVREPFNRPDWASASVVTARQQLSQVYTELTTPRACTYFSWDKTTGTYDNEAKRKNYYTKMDLCAKFDFGKTQISKAGAVTKSAPDAACESARSIDVSRTAKLAQADLDYKMQKYGADLSQVEALYDPADHKLIAHRSNDIAMELQTLLVKEFSTDRIVARAIKNQDAPFRNPQLIMISPYVSLTVEMERTLNTIKDNVAKANEQLAAKRKAPVVFDLQLITNSDLNDDEPSAQKCFNQQALPKYLALKAHVFEYVSDTKNAETIRRTGRIHQKMYLVNQEKVFVGSFNSDYRSSELNLELGVYVDASAEALSGLNNNQKVIASDFIRGVRKEINTLLKGYDYDKGMSDVLNDEQLGVIETGNIDMTTANKKVQSNLLLNIWCKQQ